MHAITIKPDDFRGWSFLGLYYSELGHVPNAINAYERARDLRPDDPDNLGSLAKAYIAGGRVSDAVTLLRNALLLDPSDEEFRELYLRTIMERNLQRNLDSAHRKAIQQANLQNPKNEDLLRYFPNADERNIIIGETIDLTHPPDPNYWNRARRRDMEIFRQGDQILLEEFINSLSEEFEHFIASIQRDTPPLRGLVREFYDLVASQGGVIAISSLQRIAKDNVVAGKVMKALHIL